MDQPGAGAAASRASTPGASALSVRASSGSVSAWSTAVCAAALTITSGRSARTVAASDSGSAKSAAVAVEVERDQLAERRQRALQLPADLAVLAEEEDLHAAACARASYCVDTQSR